MTLGSFGHAVFNVKRGFSCYVKIARRQHQMRGQLKGRDESMVSNLHIDADLALPGSF